MAPALAHDSQQTRTSVATIRARNIRPFSGHISASWLEPPCSMQVQLNPQPYRDSVAAWMQEKPTLPQDDDETIDPDIRELGVSNLQSASSCMLHASFLHR